MKYIGQMYQFNVFYFFSSIMIYILDIVIEKLKKNNPYSVKLMSHQTWLVPTISMINSGSYSLGHKISAAQ